MSTAARREENRAWVRHARAYGATRVTIWFAPGEYDDATRIEVPMTRALATLAEHVADYHVDAVGTHDGEDVTGYLSEYVVPAEERGPVSAAVRAVRAVTEDEPAEPRVERTPEQTAALEARVEERYQRHLRRKARAQRRAEWPDRPVSQRTSAAMALVFVWLVFAVPGLVIGWSRGDAGQGLQTGTMLYGAMIAAGTVYGWYQRRPWSRS